jgi:hypothetical protein
MGIDAFDRNDASLPNTSDCHQEYNEGLMEMSPSELELMQEITLYQMGQAVSDTRLVLSRVWSRLEQERLRRKADVAELEHMYFGRTPAGS